MRRFWLVAALSVALLGSGLLYAQNYDNRLNGTPAKEDDWGWQSMPVQHHELDLNQPISEEQFQFIRLGLIPRNMDDRWFIYYKDGHLYAHRSWTGVLVYDIHIEKTDDGYIATKFLVNRDPDEYLETNDHWDHEFVRSLLRYLSLDPNKPIQPKDLMWN